MKIILTTALSVLSLIGVSQIVFQEDFNNCSLPDEMGMVSNGSGWQVGSTATLESSGFPVPDNGGCFVAVNDNAVMINDASEDWLILPKIDITGVAGLKLDFDAYYPEFGPLMYVEYSNDSVLWSGTYNASQDLSTGDWQHIETFIYQQAFTNGNDLWIRFRYRDFGWETLGVAIDNIVVSVQNDYDARMTTLDGAEWFVIGTHDLRGMIQNVGVNNFGSVNINWQINGGNVNQQTVTQFGNGSTVYSSNRVPFTITDGLELVVPGDYDLKVWTTLPGGYLDGDTYRDTMDVTIHAVAELPERRVLFEKYTHTMCGPCYEGDLDFETILSDHPYATGISVHAASSDPFTTAAGDEVDDFFVYAHPGFMASRTYMAYRSDYTIWQYEGVTADVERVRNIDQAVSVSVENVVVDSITHSLDFDVVADFYGSYSDELGINAYLIEDSVFGYQASAPDPNNYQHHHVLRESFGGAWGDSFTNTDVVDNQYTKHYHLDDVSIYDFNQISLVGAVLRKGDHPSQKEVLNCTAAIKLSEIEANEPQSVRNIHDTDISIFPNPVHGTVYLDSKHAGAYELMNLNGQVMDGGNIESGRNKVSLTELQPGMYVVRVMVQDKVLTKRLVVQ